MKKFNHYDPSQPMSASNLPPEAVAEMTKNGIYQPDAIKQPDVVNNPVTGILQPAQNVVSPVTPDLQDAQITTPAFSLTPEQSAALDASVAGLDFSNIPAGGFSPYLV